MKDLDVDVVNIENKQYDSKLNDRLEQLNISKHFMNSLKIKNEMRQKFEDVENISTESMRFLDD